MVPAQTRGNALTTLPGQPDVDFPFHVFPFLGPAQSDHQFLKRSGLPRRILEPRQKIKWLTQIAAVVEPACNRRQIAESGDNMGGLRLKNFTTFILRQSPPGGVLGDGNQRRACGLRSAQALVNRSQREALTTDVVWQGAAPARAPGIYQLSGRDPKAINSFEKPDTIVPKQLDGLPVRDGRITLRLPPLSFTVVTTAEYNLDR